ncbi:MAG TPA: hypothetical protein VIU11_14420 [Nakamurella sp.]
MMRPYHWQWWQRLQHSVADALDDLHWELLLIDRRTVSANGPPPPADPPGTVARLDPSILAPSAITDTAPAAATDPATVGTGPTVSFRGIVKQSLTKKSRMDLGQRMIEMCTLSGWQSTTLNPDMPPEHKMTMLAQTFGDLAASDEPRDQYRKLLALSAVTMGWAQGIARREMRERKRLSRERKRERKAAKREAKRSRKEAKRDERARHAKGDHHTCEHE